MWLLTTESLTACAPNPYHAWTYDEAGRLLGTPFAPKDGFDREADRLEAYRVPGRPVPIERVVEDFDHYLNWRINGVEPHAVQTEPSP